MSENQASIAGIILAAGKGTRMKSDLPKGLHRVCGAPMVELVARAMRGAGVERPVIVIGHGGERMQETLGEAFDYVWQREQLGTGHAALMARDVLLQIEGPVIVAAGDTPLLDPSTFETLRRVHQESGAVATLATSVIADPQGYGRIVRDGNGEFAKIVEQKDTTDEERQVREVNAALYCFDNATLQRILPTLSNSNAQGEYYLTDVLAAIVAEGGKVVAHVFDDPNILVGVNDRWQLAEADTELRKRILKRHAVAGVTIIDPATTFVGIDVEIGVDAVLEPGTHLAGRTKIGAGAKIGPNTKIIDSEVGDRTTVLMSYIDNAKVGADVWIGPYAHLRPKADLGDGVKIGNFVEVKNVKMGRGSKANHLSYLGDGTVGEDTNIGAGTIFCNYNGYLKSKTTIGANVFVGSNSTLVAPVTLGDGSMVAAGSVITYDIPADAAAFGRARQETKDEWSAKWRSKMSERKAK
ncbi:MAG: bifunctional UDP-N-acetylglucosamine diphosphorylase/glucosamine-1-phosphate N-acetyltransferase GlmU [Fimbriimonas sp.]